MPYSKYFTVTTGTSILVGGNRAHPGDTLDHPQVGEDLATYCWRGSQCELDMNSQLSL